MQMARTFLSETALRQRGVITRRQLRDAGMDRHQAHRLVADGTLVPLGRSTYRHGAVDLDDRGRVLAACLETGGVAACRTAAWLHGLPGFAPGDPPEVLIPRPHNHYRYDVAQVHTTTWLPHDDLVEVGSIPCTSVARTLFGLAALVPAVPEDRARGAVDDAIRLGQASDRWLWWRLEKLRCRGRNGVSTFEAILTARAGGAVTESWLEREFLRVLEAAGIDAPTCQARIAPRGAFVARVDFLYEHAGVIIEVTGAVGHSTPAQRAADARRRNRLARLGFIVLEFTYEQVVGDPAAVVAEILGALGHRQAA